VFAGAAREAVFSRPEVVRRLNGEFVPVALKAALVQNPPPGPEGALYAGIARSRPAPQGICAVNGSGHVLLWALTFRDGEAVGAFLDRALVLFRARPAGPGPVERYMLFPDRRMEDWANDGRAPPVVDAHPPGQPCPALPRVAQGTVTCRLVGRALDAEGKPTRDTSSQDRYVEDRFDIPPALQAGLARAAAAGGRSRLPESLARLLASRAHLGQLDVQPLDSPVPGHVEEVRRLEFWLEPVGKGGLLRLTGESDVGGGPGAGPRSDGARYRHDIRLTWSGFVRMEGERLAEFVCRASGRESLRWSSPAFRAGADLDALARLPAGSPIDLTCEVRYGILGAPAAEEE